VTQPVLRLVGVEMGKSKKKIKIPKVKYVQICFRTTMNTYFDLIIQFY